MTAKRNSDVSKAINPVKAKRSSVQTPAASIRHTHLQIKREGSQVEDESANENSSTLWQFRADVLPAQRQTFYCVCDVLIDEVQELLHANDGLVTAFVNQTPVLFSSLMFTVCACIFAGNGVHGARWLAASGKC